MFYTVNYETGEILREGPLFPDPQKEVAIFGCAVFIIEGKQVAFQIANNDIPFDGTAPIPPDVDDSIDVAHAMDRGTL